MRHCLKRNVTLKSIFFICPNHSNTDVPFSECAVYLLTKDSSDPKTNKEIQDKQNLRVSYLEPPNTEADKRYDHKM